MANNEMKIVPAGVRRRLEIAITESLITRMKKHTSAQADENGCLIWLGARRAGYGAIKHNGRVLGSHCAAFVIAGGAFIQGNVIAHKCDVRLCVNPEHLECVSVERNALDSHERIQKGTYLKGSQKPNATIDEVIAGKIKRLLGAGWKMVDIARQVSCSTTVVERISQGKSWRHVG